MSKGSPSPANQISPYFDRNRSQFVVLCSYIYTGEIIFILKVQDWTAVLDPLFGGTYNPFLFLSHFLKIIFKVVFQHYTMVFISMQWSTKPNAADMFSTHIIQGIPCNKARILFVTCLWQTHRFYNVQLIFCLDLILSHGVMIRKYKKLSMDLSSQKNVGPYLLWAIL